MAERARVPAAEFLGTALLTATVIGSGIMAERLTGDAALALLCNSLATGAMLVVLLTLLGPISGAHLNPAVTLALALKRGLGAGRAWLCAAMQCAGGLAGSAGAALMFEAPLMASTTARTGAGLWLSEGVASFGLVATVLAGQRLRPAALPWLVGLYILAAYWFTASTAFANPAVTLARTLTDSFAGIRPADAPAFVAAQLAGALVALALTGWLLPREAGRATASS